MGVVKTPWPADYKAEYKHTKEALEHLWYFAQTVHNRGLQGRRRNPYLIDALIPEIRATAQELGDILRRVLRSKTPDKGPAPEGSPPYWVEAIKTMLADLESLEVVYQDLTAAHRRGNLSGALLLSDTGLEGLSYITRVFSSIPLPDKRQTMPIKAPEVPEAWKDFIDNLNVEGL